MQIKNAHTRVFYLMNRFLDLTALRGIATLCHCLLVDELAPTRSMCFSWRRSASIGDGYNTLQQSTCLKSSYIHPGLVINFLFHILLCFFCLVVELVELGKLVYLVNLVELVGLGELVNLVSSLIRFRSLFAACGRRSSARGRRRWRGSPPP